jgi:hypothetical protein
LLAAGQVPRLHGWHHTCWSQCYHGIELHACGLFTEGCVPSAAVLPCRSSATPAWVAPYMLFLCYYHVFILHQMSHDHKHVAQGCVCCCCC